MKTPNAHHHPNLKRVPPPRANTALNRAGTRAADLLEELVLADLLPPELARDARAIVRALRAAGA